MNYAKWLLAVALVVPVSALALYKPVRVVLPETFGVHCEHNICIDDLTQLDTAVTLFNTAKRYLETAHGLSVGEPRIVFCTTAICRRNFGLGKKAGFTFGTFGITIAPRGWKEYYVAHELIHYWQAENFGNLVLISAAPWLIEGMAYSLSNDPRKALHEPFESYRQRFNAWYRPNSVQSLKKSFGEAL